MHNFFCTTSLHARPETLDQGRLWAQAIGATFIERQNKPLADMFRELAVDALLIYTATGPEIQTNQGKHKFQLSMAELRIQQLRKGGSDHFLRALQATGPLSLLDCTCGFGSDSIVASFGLPPGSTVAGLESSPYLYAVTSWGLQHFVHERDDVTAALRRITLRHGDYVDFLQAAAAPEYDILYFDPMFAHPIMESPQFMPVRSLMNHEVLTLDHIDQACTKARKRVVIKGRDFKDIVRAFPDVRLYGGKYSRVGYAVLECSRG